MTKHLESIGTLETIAAVKTRLLQGKSQARVINSQTAPITGKDYLVSDKEKILLKMNFEMLTAVDYPREHIGYNGNKINAPFVTPTSRSALGNFAYSYKEIFKTGLFGGTLTTNWALLDAKKNISKFEYAGKEKIGETEAQLLRWSLEEGPV